MPHKPLPHDLTCPKIIRDCIPKLVQQYVFTLDKCVHNHKSIIINLVCGATIRKDCTRAALLDG